MTVVSGGNQQDELDLLEIPRQTTREAYETCLRKRWKINIPRKGKKIVIRDLLSKIAHWIDFSKPVGDQVMQYDPGNLARPWAGPRFLLQIANNGSNKFDFVVQCAERISRMMARYRIIERVYIRNLSAAMNSWDRRLQECSAISKADGV